MAALLHGRRRTRNAVLPVLLCSLLGAIAFVPASRTRGLQYQQRERSIDSRLPVRFMGGPSPPPPPPEETVGDKLKAAWENPSLRSFIGFVATASTLWDVFTLLQGDPAGGEAVDAAAAAGAS
mmetsp:Transcript_23165/g.41864  ORF Transcript_23165/g.41864 Transcript_23165/m.41864 type:complete len:123 (-) Transcript_23165:127-495(-)|eukprot:CAMPEP_0197663922 /NCGR_PEP_ID=MMETSP1338-20131121/58326_1 /TAXON_ID=43686 ORGANISM="Pelagodinium beii, Strain RCC1491" /NCGR_SAMPLE_ID=MMETSP1338 /ASSEMBLY_ACC=CAM_ASM_000754 /LENGTH=122 /DNA_ID=CAMNT_0043242457 /DNA_START=21 /DNA_END=389 /DNA_ORIENTATION=-